MKYSFICNCKDFLLYSEKNIISISQIVTRCHALLIHKHNLLKQQKYIYEEDACGVENYVVLMNVIKLF